MRLAGRGGPRHSGWGGGSMHELRANLLVSLVITLHYIHYITSERGKRPRAQPNALASCRCERSVTRSHATSEYGGCMGGGRGRRAGAGRLMVQGGGRGAIRDGAGAVLGRGLGVG